MKTKTVIIKGGARYRYVGLNVVFLCTAEAMKCVSFRASILQDKHHYDNTLLL